MTQPQLTKDTQNELIEEFQRDYIRKAVLTRRSEIFLDRIKKIIKKQEEIDRKLLALQSIRLSLEFKIGELSMDRETAQREAIFLAKKRYDLPPEKLIAAVSEAERLIQGGTR